MEVENEDGDGDALKPAHKSTSSIITLNTIINRFPEDSIIVKCMPYILWYIHGNNGKVRFPDINKNRDNNIEATKNYE